MKGPFDTGFILIATALIGLLVWIVVDQTPHSEGAFGDPLERFHFEGHAYLQRHSSSQYATTFIHDPDCPCHKP